MQMEKRFSELVSTISHELRTPLTGIKGYATTLLREDASWEPATWKEMVEIIDQESNTMSNLIEDLMSSSMIEAGFLRIRRQPVLMSRVVKKVVEDVSAKTQSHRFFVDLPDKFPVLEGDPDRLRQALFNLLDNAIKYSPKGGLIVIRGQLSEPEVLISVADQGIGIAPEDLNRLFERFYRVKSDLAGTGLGLPVTREIIEKHGGRIWAKSIPGRGSTFFFTLPLSELSLAEDVSILPETPSSVASEVKREGECP